MPFFDVSHFLLTLLLVLGKQSLIIQSLWRIQYAHNFPNGPFSLCLVHPCKVNCVFFLISMSHNLRNLFSHLHLSMFFGSKLLPLLGLQMTTIPLQILHFLHFKYLQQHLSRSFALWLRSPGHLFPIRAVLVLRTKTLKMRCVYCRQCSILRTTWFRHLLYVRTRAYVFKMQLRWL